MSSRFLHLENKLQLINQTVINHLCVLLFSETTDNLQRGKGGGGIHKYKEKTRKSISYTNQLENP